MSAILNKVEEFTIFEAITCHPAWHGNISGLAAEKMLRGQKTPYLFIIRKGENNASETEDNYYVSFVLPDLTIHHQPVVITQTTSGWCYENGKPGGPYNYLSFDPVVHQIMHCEQDQCVPFIRK